MMLSSTSWTGNTFQWERKTKTCFLPQGFECLLHHPILPFTSHVLPHLWHNHPFPLYPVCKSTAHLSSICCQCHSNMELFTPIVVCSPFLRGIWSWLMFNFVSCKSLSCVLFVSVLGFSPCNFSGFVWATLILASAWIAGSPPTHFCM